jgi:hypothetical protein
MLNRFSVNVLSFLSIWVKIEDRPTVVIQKFHRNCHVFVCYCLGISVVQENF